MVWHTRAQTDALVAMASPGQCSLSKGRKGTMSDLFRHDVPLALPNNPLWLEHYSHYNQKMHIVKDRDRGGQ